MPLRATLLALLLCASTVSAAEIKTLKNEVFKGDVVSVNSKEVVLDVAGEKKTFAVSAITAIDFSAAGKLPPDAKYHHVELVDGSLLQCTEIGFKGKDFTVKLGGEGQTVKVPMNAVANVLWDAHLEKRRKDWSDRISKRRNFDAFGVDDEGIVQMLEVTISGADEKGETIAFKKGTFSGNRKMGTFVGLYFQRTPDSKAPPVVCKASDLSRSSLMVAGVESKEDGLHVLTSAGVTLIYKPEQLVRLDYSTANVAYLSDLTPSKVEETSTEERIEHFRKDRNMDDRPIRLQGQIYPKGLALHSTTTLEYRLKGDYRTFQAIAGIDDQVGGHNRPVVLRIYVDNIKDPVFEHKFTRKDAKERVKPISLNIKDVEVLRIVVTHDDFLDLGLHLDLADARVIK